MEHYLGGRTMPDNLLYFGDNLDVLRRHVQDESVDLVYLDPPFGGMKCPRLQILTIEDLLAGKQIEMPPNLKLTTFKKAPRAKAQRQETGDLFAAGDESE
jgi:hypothetical protein